MYGNVDKRGVIVSVYLPRDIAAYLNKNAARNDRSLSAEVRRWLMRALAAKRTGADEDDEDEDYGPDAPCGT